MLKLALRAMRVHGSLSWWSLTSGDWWFYCNTRLSFFFAWNWLQRYKVWMEKIVKITISFITVSVKAKKKCKAPFRIHHIQSTEPEILTEIKTKIVYCDKIESRPVQVSKWKIIIDDDRRLLSNTVHCYVNPRELWWSRRQSLRLQIVVRNFNGQETTRNKVKSGFMSLALMKLFFNLQLEHYHQPKTLTLSNKNDLSKALLSGFLRPNDTHEPAFVYILHGR